MPRLTTITAAAGAGKTTRIVNDIADEVLARTPEQILATTFTIKAADELVERARAKLFEQGKADAAAQLLGARFGTVNAVCSQIVNEFAIDLGRSPSTNVIGESNMSLVFSVAADAAIAARAEILNELSDHFGYNDPRAPGTGEPPDWRRTVRTIATLARANGIETEQLAFSAQRSAESFLACFPSPAAEGADLDAALASALKDAVEMRPAAVSNTGADSVETIRAAHERILRGETLSWPTWARLTKVKCAPTKDGQPYNQALARLIAAAGRHSEHPRLRSECEQFITETFDCAAEALTAYRDWKAERGLLDFTDQEALALDILKTPDLAARLKERVSRVFVDEFQDSSPLQLAVFTLLGELVEESTWVGDPKQAIYGFRGADTELTQAAFLGAGGAPEDNPVLSKSWRSRKSLVGLFNAMFTPVFERMGLPAAQHAFSDAARSDDGFEKSSAGWWWLIGKIEEQAQALAEGIRQSLTEADKWLVEDDKHDHRPIMPGDIAILCRSNTDVGRFAAALSRAGLPVAVERSGLTRTPHVEFVLAACRRVADATDRLALAELARFFADDAGSDAWLRAASSDDADPALRVEVPISDALDRLAEQLLNFTPAELVDAVLAMPALLSHIESWGDTAMRFDDLEALRGFSRAYEGECAASGSPATLQGFLLALDGAEPKRPPSLANDAIQVMTYHGSKGLEWPMTILTGLSWESKARLFEPVAETTGELDWRNPLSERWIRFWPWPYGQSGKGSTIDVEVATSEIGRRALQRAVEEDTRLLYVGATRARDYLIFAPPGKGNLNWLGLLNASEAATHIVPPQSDDNQLGVGCQNFTVDMRALSASGEATERAALQTFVRARVTEPAARLPLFLRPSDADGGNWRVVEKVDLGGRLPIDGIADIAALGEALHSIIGYDDPDRDRDQRLADATSILTRWNVTGFKADDALIASDRLATWRRGRWPASSGIAEVPVTAPAADQLLKGRVDMLVETGIDFAIIDHKSFPGRFELWEDRAVGHAPQLAAYAGAVETVTGRRCSELWIHMPIVGALFRVGPPDP
ncbi:DNA helicase UvrD [Rhizobium chutanense]|uniref:DNA 3'-5' helicase n=1 Tax=Rhizobium chutanense TaxID=2035448 RepID=A0A2A6J5Q4_9HYPH|nr:UvrD-helicase domain-containing protein [Rhizobium chutanense]PDT01415.1 DNA helicase UvrD [Rhizobium chutanense]